jgi:hypothetical protein
MTDDPAADLTDPALRDRPQHAFTLKGKSVDEEGGS